MGRKKKTEKKTHTEAGGGRGDNSHLIFLLSVGNKWENLKLIFNTIIVWWNIIICRVTFGEI